MPRSSSLSYLYCNCWGWLVHIIGSRKGEYTRVDVLTKGVFHSIFLIQMFPMCCLFSLFILCFFFFSSSLFSSQKLIFLLYMCFIFSYRFTLSMSTSHHGESPLSNPNLRYSSSSSERIHSVEISEGIERIRGRRQRWR